MDSKTWHPRKQGGPKGDAHLPPILCLGVGCCVLTPAFLFLPSGSRFNWPSIPPALLGVDRPQVPGPSAWLLGAPRMSIG